MISLLIITHEQLGQAYTTLINHFFPNHDFSHTHILNVEKTDDQCAIINRVHTILPQLDQGNGVLIFTDIFGATPCNAALKMIAAHKFSMISGLNAPMLIKAISYYPQYTDLVEFTQLVKQAGLDGIMSFTQAD
jgi:hypothetical protein